MELIVPRFRSQRAELSVPGDEVTGKLVQHVKSENVLNFPGNFIKHNEENSIVIYADN